LLLIAAFFGWAAYTLTRHLEGSSTTASTDSAIAADVLRVLSTMPLTDTGNKTTTLAVWQGKILVVNYWATWCPPCRAEMPGFSRLAEKYGAKNVQFIGIGIDSSDNIRQFSKDTPTNYPLVIGTPEHLALASQLGNPAQGLPFTLLLDATGRLHSVKIGRMTESDLEQRLISLISNAKQGR
ncbi:MAG: TlpA family protein disulfide reductase, partial [Deltaproteobacteria bacterium]|nr:TlpA family protein disulfide reductase [Deltaproteobacteria bacterium]